MSRAMLDSSGLLQLQADGTELLQDPGDECCCGGGCTCVTDDGNSPPCDCTSWTLTLPGVGTFTLVPLSVSGLLQCCVWGDYDPDAPVDCATTAALQCGGHGNQQWSLDVFYLPCDDAGCNYQWQTPVNGPRGPSTTFADWTPYDPSGFIPACAVGQTFTLECDDDNPLP